MILSIRPVSKNPIAFASTGISLWASSVGEKKKERSFRKYCWLLKWEREHTDLLLSQSESLLRRLRIDQRERLLREELRDHERDGGSRSTEGFPCSSSSTLQTIGKDGDARDGLLSLSPFLLSQAFSPDLSSCCSLAFLFSRLRKRYRCTRGLGEQDHDSVSDDGGRMFSIGMEMGSAIRISGGVVIAITKRPSYITCIRRV